MYETFDFENGCYWLFNVIFTAGKHVAAWEISQVHVYSIKSLSTHEEDHTCIASTTGFWSLAVPFCILAERDGFSRDPSVSDE